MNDFWWALAAALAAAAATVLAGRAVARRLPPGDRRAVAAGLGVAAIGVVAFLALAQAWQAPAAWAMDQAAAEAARRAWTDAGARAMGLLTHVGDRTTQWAVGIAGACVLAWRREALAGIAWVVVLLGNAVWVPTLKGLYARVRPEADLSGIATDGASFPSGHTAGAMVVYGMLAWLLCRRLPSRWHAPVLLAAAAVVVGVGASRVYLQAHYLSDVLGGLASGGAWLAFGIAAALAWERRQAPVRR